MTSTPGGRRGMALVIVIVLIAVLFLAGTVMALVVSSNLHTVDVAANHDAIHYAAESAVARGVGALGQQSSCAPLSGGSLNGQVIQVWCSPGPVDPDDPEQDSTVSGKVVIPGGLLSAAGCTTTALPASPSPITAWTVVGWRGSGTLRAWTDRQQQLCVPTSGTICSLRSVFASTANVAYALCHPQTSDTFFHVAASAPVTLGTSVFRWVPRGDHSIRTVVGLAGFEVDEADLVPGTRPSFWNTVLP